MASGAGHRITRQAPFSLGWCAVAVVAGLALLARGAPALTLSVLSEAAAVGTWGLRIVVDRACSADDLELTGSLSGIYSACESLAVSEATTEPGSTELRAGQTVRFGNGFTVSDGTDLSVAIDPSMRSALFLEQDHNLANTPRLFAEYYLRLDNLNQVGTFNNMAFYTASGTALFEVVIEQSSSTYLASLRVREDPGTMRATAKIVVPGGWQRLWMRWEQGDGNGLVFLNVGEEFVGLFDLDNDQAGDVAYYRWGVIDGIDPGASGHFDLDHFLTWR